MRRLLVSLTALAAAAAGALAIPGPAAAPAAPARPVASELVETTFGCTIILRSTGPVLLDDASHHCDPRYTSAYLDSAGILYVTYVPVVKVVDARVGPDESEVIDPRDATMGPSVGLDHMWIRFAREGVQVRADGPNVACGSCNIFVRVWALIPAVEPSPSPTPAP